MLQLTSLDHGEKRFMSLFSGAVESPSMGGNIGFTYTTQPYTQRASVRGYLNEGSRVVNGDRQVFHTELFGTLCSSTFDVAVSTVSTDAGDECTKYTIGRRRCYEIPDRLLTACGHCYEIGEIELDYRLKLIRVTCRHYPEYQKDHPPAFQEFRFPFSRGFLFPKVGEAIPMAVNAVRNHIPAWWAERARKELFGDYGHLLPLKAEYGSLCQEAVQGTKVIDINTLMYCKDLLETGQLLKGQLTDLANLKKAPIKSVANLFLSNYYGTRLTIRDTKELYHAAKREWNSVRRKLGCTRARYQWTDSPEWGPFSNISITRVRTAKVWYSETDNLLGRILNDLFRWDVFPELGNIWDLIPYSFVIDWFFPVADLWDQVDSRTYASTLKVSSVVFGEKATCNLPASNSMVQSLVGPGWSESGSLRLSVYRRSITRELIDPPFRLELDSQPFHNWLPAGALILQRLK